MSLNTLEEIASYIVSDGKGILAADESNLTCGKRFDSIGVESNEDNRRDYREMLFRSSGMKDNIGGVILFDETIRQNAKDGTSLVDIISNQGAAQAAANDFEAAEASYMEIAADSSFDPLYQQAATLLSVMVAPQDADLGVLQARLADLETAAGPWQAMALETGAGLALRSGDRDAAMSRYKKLVEMADIPAGMRQRADRMTAILSD